MQRGGSRGGARGARPPHPTLFFDQNEARRVKKNSFGDRPPLISGSGWPCPPPYLRVWMTVSPPYLRVWMTVSPPLISGSGWPCLPPLSQGLDPPLCSEKRRQKKRTFWSTTEDIYSLIFECLFNILKCIAHKHLSSNLWIRLSQPLTPCSN